MTNDYQNAKETIAANNARIKSLEDQLAQAKESAAALQGSLDRSLNNANSNNINISNSLTKSMRVISISVTWWK